MNRPESRSASRALPLELHEKLSIADTLITSVDELSIFGTPSVKTSRIGDVMISEELVTRQHRGIGRAILTATFAELPSGTKQIRIDTKSISAIPDRSFSLEVTPDSTHDTWYATEGDAKIARLSHEDVVNFLQTRLADPLEPEKLDQSIVDSTAMSMLLQGWLSRQPNSTYTSTTAYRGDGLVIDDSGLYETGAVITHKQTGDNNRYTGRIGTTQALYATDRARLEPNLYPDEVTFIEQSYGFTVKKDSRAAFPASVEAQYTATSPSLSRGKLEDLASHQQYNSADTLKIVETLRKTTLDNQY